MASVGVARVGARFLVAAAAVSALAAVSACGVGTTDRYRTRVSAWVDRPVDDLMAQWGEPDMTEQKGDGLVAYEYALDGPGEAPLEDLAPAAGPGALGSPVVEGCVTRFVADDGIIRTVSFWGQDCQA